MMSTRRYRNSLTGSLPHIYFNILTVLRPFDEAVGEYSCTVANSNGNDTTKTTVKGKLRETQYKICRNNYFDFAQLWRSLVTKGHS